MARALLIDFGGTIAREAPPRHAIYAEAAVRLGLDVASEEMARLMGEAHGALPLRVRGSFRYTRPWFEAFIERIFGERLGVAASRLDGVKAELFARFADPGTFLVHDDARALLDAARTRGMPIAIVSNWSDALQPLVEALELGPIDALLSSAVERCEKPDPALFDAACARLGVAPADALHVGDSLENDARGAAEAGLSAVLLDRGGRASAPAPASAPGAPFTTVTSLCDAIPLLGPE